MWVDSSFSGYEGVGGNTGITPVILRLGVRWRGVVNFTLCPIYPLGITPMPICKGG